MAAGWQQKCIFGLFQNIPILFFISFGLFQNTPEVFLNKVGLFINKGGLFRNKGGLFRNKDGLFINNAGLLMIPNTSQTKESLPVDDSDSYFFLHLMIMP